MTLCDDRRRRRDRRLRLRRRVVRARAAAARPRVALLERGRHPRFAIGESTTPLTNLLLEELADRYDLPQIRVVLEVGHVAAGASGRRLRPQARVHVPLPPTSTSASRTTRDHARQLLVAASPNDDVADTHWYRPDFDLALVARRRRAGAIYLDETRLETRSAMPARGCALEGTRAGPRRRRHRRLRHRRERAARIPGDRARHSAARRCGGCRRRKGSSRTSKTSSSGRTWRRPAEAPPYPPDAAALHHVFPGGWIWVLRFNNGITSAGAALTDPLAAQRASPPKAPRRGTDCWRRCRRCASSSAPRAPTLPFVHAPRVAFRCREVVGDEVGAAAVGRRRHRSAALDRLPADAARPRAAARAFSKRPRPEPSARRRSPRTRARRKRSSTSPNSSSRRSTRAWPTRRSSSG